MARGDTAEEAHRGDVYKRQGVYRACAVNGDTVYYISALDRTQLMHADVQNAVVEQAAVANAAMTCLLYTSRCV